jgi:hypothetical protein
LNEHQCRAAIPPDSGHNAPRQSEGAVQPLKPVPCRPPECRRVLRVLSHGGYGDGLGKGDNERWADNFPSWSPTGDQIEFTRATRTTQPWASIIDR